MSFEQTDYYLKDFTFLELLHLVRRGMDIKRPVDKYSLITRHFFGIRGKQYYQLFDHMRVNVFYAKETVERRLNQLQAMEALIGLAALDLPVLLTTQIAEWVSDGDFKTNVLTWDNARLVKAAASK